MEAEGCPLATELSTFAGGSNAIAQKFTKRQKRKFFSSARLLSGLP
ncbi:MAG: hypothetical protein V7K48_14830 [Nostoc sp.]